MVECATQRGLQEVGLFAYSVLRERHCAAAGDFSRLVYIVIEFVFGAE